jgi:hypothetical protein
MTSFFDNLDTELQAAARRRVARRRRWRTRAGVLVAAAALLVPAGAIATRDVWAPPADRQGSSDPAPPGFHAVGPVTRPVFIARGAGPHGPWRLSAYACGDRRPDHVVLGLHPRARVPSPPCYYRRTHDAVRELDGHETLDPSIGATIAYGVTSTRVDTVLIRPAKGPAQRVATRAVDPALARRANLPDFHFYAVQVGGNGYVRQLVALSHGRTVECLPDCRWPRPADEPVPGPPPSHPPRLKPHGTPPPRHR